MSRDQRPGGAKIVDNGKSRARSAPQSAPRAAASASVPVGIDRAAAPATSPPGVSIALLGLVFVAATVGSAAAVAALLKLPL